ncbi:MAG: hypothetical protein KM310_07045 [Clostridiales bacterium]|nr:hypothetical protein [Clostridiales bacterium]
MNDYGFPTLSQIQTEEMLRRCRDKLQETLHDMHETELAVQELVLRVLKQQSLPRQNQSLPSYIRLVGLRIEEELTVLYRYIRELKAELSKKEKALQELQASGKTPDVASDPQPVQTAPPSPGVEAFFPDLSPAAQKALSLHLEKGYVLDEHFKALRKGVQELAKKEILRAEKVTLPTGEPGWLYLPGPKLQGLPALARAPLETARWETTHPDLAKGYVTARLAAIYRARGYEIDQSLAANRLGKTDVWSTFLAVKDSDVQRVFLILDADDLEQAGAFISAFAAHDIEERDFWVIAGLQAQANAFRQLFAHYAMTTPELDSKAAILWITTYRSFIDQKGERCWLPQPAGPNASRRLEAVKEGPRDE